MPNEKPLKLYFDFISQPSRALYIILNLSGKSFEAHRLNVLQGEHLTEEYKDEVNRFKKIPAIIDGDFKLAESVAILRYFSNREYIDEGIYPADLCQRAKVDEFLQWQHTGIRSSCSLYFRFIWVQPKIAGITVEAGKIAKYKREMERDLKIMETIWLRDGKFLTGDTLTAADIFGACEVEQIRVTGYKIRNRYPKVAAWIEAVRSKLHPYFDEAHQVVYKYEKETEAEALKV